MARRMRQFDSCSQPVFNRTLLAVTLATLAGAAHAELVQEQTFAAHVRGLPDGVTVRVGAAVEEAALRRVLAALGRR